uniref:Uncharacterized protein n=1 Tax=viral metagenome TaxID=1070528 RepID=A0A6C0B9C3_9ZZZZ
MDILKMSKMKKYEIKFSEKVSLLVNAAKTNKIRHVLSA